MGEQRGILGVYLGPRVQEKHNRMKGARGQEKSKTGSSVRSQANPRGRQALSKGSSTYRLQGIMS